MGKAFLVKKWGANYAGQTLTGVTKGSIPDDVARFYEDDEPTPNDVVKDDSAVGANNPLQVTNDELDPERADEVADDKRAIVERVKEGKDSASIAAENEAAEREDTQRRAREADEFAAKRQAPKAGKGKTAASSKGSKSKRTAGKEHGVK